MSCYGLRNPRINCPACGAALDCTDDLDLDAQMRRLKHLQMQIELGNITARGLRSEIHRMCGMCQLMIIGVPSDTDHHSLAEQIEKSIELRDRFSSNGHKAA